MLNWLKNPKIFSALLAMLLIGLLCVLWLTLGFGKGFFLWAAFSVLLLVVAVLIVDRVMARHSGGLLEMMFRKDADNAVLNASPEERADVSQLRSGLLRAIDTIKKSRIGRTRGTAALYELPWYMMLGHSSAGKSSAIDNSGLVFPLKGKDGNAVKGVGGTRDCDWFFSTEGILLDTAGRYSDQPKDRPEWLGFLKLLKKHRPQAPINGILVALSLPELQKPQSEFFANYARQIRQRVNEVDEVFGMKVPIYIMITKMDLLGGFSSFFEDFTDEERRQVWGATLTHEQGKDFDAVRVVGEHFEALHRGVIQIGQEKLALNRGNLKRQALFAFPIEFHGIKEPLCRFIEMLTEEDPYHTKPLIRGFCFSSSLQDGRPNIATGLRIAGAFGLPEPPAMDTSVPSRAYFLETLFKQVIFPDQYLVGMAKSRHDRMRIVGLAAGLLLLTIAVGIWTLSFVMNQKLIREAASEKQECMQAIRSGSIPEKLGAMQLLQVRIEQLQAWSKKSRPLSYGWGLYRGKDIEESLLKEYFQGIQNLLLGPVKGRLEEGLSRFLKGQTLESAEGENATAEAGGAANAQETAYNALKTYLMLQDRQHLDAAHLTDQLPRYWKPWLEKSTGQKTLDESTHRIAERTIAFFVSQIEKPELPTIQGDPGLVDESRKRIHGEIQFLDPHQRVYNQIKAIANAKYGQVTVGTILDNKDQDIIGGSTVVSGAFCQEAWKAYIQPTIQEAASGKFKGSDWVLNSSVENDLTRHGAQEQNIATLTRLYKADYIKEWERFLSGVALLGFETPDKSATTLGRLAAIQTSPIKLLLQRAAAETSWDNPSESEKAMGSIKKNVLDKANALLGTTSASNNPSGPARGEVGSRFAILSTLVSGEKPPIDNYLEVLQKVRSKLSAVGAAPDPAAAARQTMQAAMGGGGELTEAANYVDNVMLAQAAESEKTALRAILLRPLMKSSGSMTGLVEQDLNRLWSQQVFGAWQNLAVKYPFADSNNDAALADIVRFLKPGEGTLPRFIDTYLTGFVARQGDSLSPRSFGGVSIGFSPAFLSGVSRLQQAARVVQEGETSCFELKPQPTAGIMETYLDINGENLVYRNGPQFWKSITWPSPKGNTGIQLRLVSESGVSTQLLNHQGRLDIMRWLDKARIDNPNATTTILEWAIPANQALATKGRKPGAVRFEFRMVSGANPLKFKALRHHNLPSRITR